MRAVGHARGQFDPSVDRPRSQDYHVALGALQSLLGYSVERKIFVNRREETGLLPLELNAQHVDDVAARQHVVEVVGDLDTQFLERPGHERGRTACDDMCAELCQRPDVGTRYAAV